MNALLVAAFVALVSAARAAPSGVHGGAIVSGPSGIVTNAGPIGPAGHGVGLGLGLGLGHGGVGLGHGVALAAPVALSSVGVGHGIGLGGLGGLGLGGLGLGGLGLGHGLGLGGLGVGHGLALGAVTNGGGTIGVSSHGATIAGPGTAPVVVAGPSGKIAADGLWGPTANVGLTGGHGGWGHGGWGHGHGW